MPCARAAARLSLEARDLDLGRGTEHDFPVEHYGSFLVLTVRDTGHGMTPEFADKIFDPFFTTKQDGMGTGLGLTVVHNIVARLGGLIRVESEIGNGSAFHVLLPKSPRPAREAEARPVSPDLRGRERILLVDDQPLMLSGARAVLEGLGYNVEDCLSAAQAMETFRDNPRGFDLVVADLTMPDMTGLDLARELLQIRPDLPVIISSGYGGLLSAELVRGAGIREFVKKPYSTEEMASAVRRVLDS